MADWVLSTQLTALQLSGCRMRAIPPAICKLPLLVHLTISGAGTALTEIPKGPFLLNLRTLSISKPATGVAFKPEVLAMASGLQILFVRSVFFAESLHEEPSQEDSLWTKANLRSILPACHLECVLGTNAYGQGN